MATRTRRSKSKKVQQQEEQLVINLSPVVDNSSTTSIAAKAATVLPIEPPAAPITTNVAADSVLPKPPITPTPTLVAIPLSGVPLPEKAKDNEPLTMKQLQELVLTQARLIETLKQDTTSSSSTTTSCETSSEHQHQQHQQQTSYVTPSVDGQVAQEIPMVAHHVWGDRYSRETVNVSPRIVLKDGTTSRWGAAPQTQTNVGMRTRSLLLNPTLQQPAIGGLM